MPERGEWECGLAGRRGGRACQARERAKAVARRGRGGEGSWRAAAEARGDKARGGGERGRARPSGRPRSHGRGKEGGSARGREEDGGVKAAVRRGAGAERAAAAAEAAAPAGAAQGSAVGSGSGARSALLASLSAGGGRRARRRAPVARGRGEYPAAVCAELNPRTLGRTDPRTRGPRARWKSEETRVDPRPGEAGKFMRNFAHRLGGGGAEGAPHVRARQGLGVVVAGLDNRLEGGGRSGLS